MEESNLEELKKEYEVIRERYQVPSFDKLNLDFNIEKAADIETDYLIREIRKFIADKFSNYLRFIDAILHPSNSPMFVLSIVKLINTEEKEKLTKIYNKLEKKEIKIVQLDLEFSEEKEVEFIKESYILWQGMKQDLMVFFNRIEEDWEHKPHVNGKNYFG